MVIKNKGSTSRSKKVGLTAKLVCTACGREKAITTGFYVSYSSMYKHNSGRMPVCKDCFYNRYKELLVKYDRDEIKTLYHICMQFDIYFDSKLIETSQENIKNDELSTIRIYMKNVNSLKQNKGKDSLSSECVILDNDVIKKIEEKYRNEYEELITSTVKKKKDKTINEDIRKKWGREYSDEECLLLEDYYEEYFENYNHNGDYAKLDILKEICTFKLIISQAKRDRDNKTIKDFSDLISKKMADAGLKPCQQKELGEGSEDTFGVRLRVYETEKPVPEIQDSLKDVDGFWKYHMKYLVKPFAMAMDLAKGSYSIDEGDKIELNKELSKHMVEETENNE